MTTMTNFSTIAERIGKTPSEKKAVEAMANALGSVENAKVNKKSFIASGIKFSLWKVTDKDSCGLRRKDGKKRAIFTSPSRIDGIVEIEF